MPSPCCPTRCPHVCMGFLPFLLPLHKQVCTPLEEGVNPSPPPLSSVQGWLHRRALSRHSRDGAETQWRGVCPSAFFRLLHAHGHLVSTSMCSILGWEPQGIECHSPTPGHATGSLSYWRLEGDRGWPW